MVGVLAGARTAWGLSNSGREGKAHGVPTLRAGRPGAMRSRRSIAATSSFAPAPIGTHPPYRRPNRGTHEDADDHQEDQGRHGFGGNRRQATPPAAG